MRKGESHQEDRQVVRDRRVASKILTYLHRGLLQRKILNQMFHLAKLKSSLRKFYDRHHDLDKCYRIFVSQISTDMFNLS